MQRSSRVHSCGHQTISHDLLHKFPNEIVLSCLSKKSCAVCHILAFGLSVSISWTEWNTELSQLSLYRHIKHVAMIAYSWKVGGYFIWFDVNFFPYFTGFENSKKQFFQLALRTFAWLGELLLKFPLVFAQMRQKIDRKFVHLSKKAKREIRSHSFCTIVYCFDQWQVERNVAWIENCDTLKITHQDIYTLSIFFSPCKNHARTHLKVISIQVVSIQTQVVSLQTWSQFNTA